jgi:hypothetical protein
VVRLTVVEALGIWLVDNGRALSDVTRHIRSFSLLGEFNE